MRKRWLGVGASSPAIALALVVLAPIVVRASDHADPVGGAKESNLTDLFFFPQGEQFVLIFDVRPASTAPLPYDLDDKTFTVNFASTARSRFDNAADRACATARRSSIPAPSAPKPRSRIGLNDDGSLRGGRSPAHRRRGIRVWTGIRDDPFIFPPFFKKNVVAMWSASRATSFPWGRGFRRWATDDEGRASRSTTSAARSAPSCRVTPRPTSTSSRRRTKCRYPRGHQARNKVGNFLMKYKETAGAIPLWQSTLQMKPFDPVPDVMVSPRVTRRLSDGRLLTPTRAATCRPATACWSICRRRPAYGHGDDERQAVPGRLPVPRRSVAERAGAAGGEEHHPAGDLPRAAAALRAVGDPVLDRLQAGTATCGESGAGMRRRGPAVA